MCLLRHSRNIVGPQFVVEDAQIISDRSLKQRGSTLVVVNSGHRPTAQQGGSNAVVEVLLLVTNGKLVVIGDGQVQRGLIQSRGVLTLPAVRILRTVVELAEFIFSRAHLLGPGKAGQNRESIVEVTLEP